MERKLITAALMLSFILKGSLLGWGQSSTPANSNYVVIGAFAIPRNAVEFVSEARSRNLQAQYAINPVRNLFYVYVLQSESKGNAIDQAKKLRTSTPYFDTWVYSGLLGDTPATSGDDINPITGENFTIVKANDSNVVTPPKQEQQENVTPVEIQDVPTTTIASTDIDEVGQGKNFLFQISVANTSKTLNGDIDVFDLDRSKKAASYRGNENVRIRPVNKSGNISFSCEVFGYRKVQIPVNYNDPGASEGVEMKDNVAVVPFKLTRLKKGDFAVMYNVYFYKDAAIMRPESRYEVTSLLEMLQENPKYKIRIHGHTNGNAHGKIISTDGKDGFFSLNDTKEGFGSAKKLSEERSKVIQNFLTSQGIDPKRTHIKAWGGKRPVFDKHSQQAQANVRVEIEILED